MPVVQWLAMNSNQIPLSLAGRRSLALAVIVLSACAGSPSGSSVPSAPASEAGSSTAPELPGRIVFVRSGGIYGDGTVFAANADGSDEHQLSEIGEGCCAFATRDGARVLFDTLAPDGRVTTATVNFDGSDRFVIPLLDDRFGLGPGPFSPDGTQIAFEAVVDEAAHPELSGIYIGSAEGTNLVRITQNGGIPADWSPDGTQVLFYRDEPSHSLFIVNVDGSGERQLTPNELGVRCCWGYRWSLEGSRILFASDDGILWLIDSDGTDPAQLFVDEKVAHARRSAWTPTWSPDGRQVMFALEQQSFIEMSTNGLYVIDADGTGLTLVIGDNTFKREPSWVP